MFTALAFGVMGVAFLVPEDPSCHAEALSLILDHLNILIYIDNLKETLNIDWTSCLTYSRDCGLCLENPNLFSLSPMRFSSASNCILQAA